MYFTESFACFLQGRTKPYISKKSKKKKNLETSLNEMTCSDIPEIFEKLAKIQRSNYLKITKIDRWECKIYRHMQQNISA